MPKAKKKQGVDFREDPWDPDKGGYCECVAIDYGNSQISKFACGVCGARTKQQFESVEECEQKTGMI